MARASHTLPIAGDWSFAGVAEWIALWAGILAHEGFERAPVPVMVLSAVLIVPVAAVLGYAVSSFGYRLLRSRRVPGGTDVVDAADVNEPAPWPSRAWLDIEGHRRSPLPDRAMLVRIGRHEDNEISIPDTSVHRHHAIIQRTVDADYVITDLSGHEGNGVLINGERHDAARLFDGDVIQLGEARMRFESALL